jgi:hypothetical protein
MPRKVNRIFVKQPSNPRGKGLGPPRPLRPSRYFGLLMMNLGKPPSPPNRPYHHPFNYPKYMKDFDPNVHVIIFKAAIRVNGETKDAKIVDLFSFTFTNTVYDWCNNYMGDYLNCTYAEL